MKKTIGIIATVALLVVSQSQVHAAIALFNTGVNNDHTVRSNNQAELHYTATYSATNPLVPSPPAQTPVTIRVATDSNGYPLSTTPNAGPWLGDNSTSAWIGPGTPSNTGVNATNPQLLAAPGFYTYSTTFDLTGYDPSTAIINGRWSTDNPGIAVVLNGNVIANTTPFAGFNVWTTLNPILSGFSAGVNTLSFIVENGATSNNPTGLRTELSISATPEPTTVVVWSGLAAIGGIVAYRRKKLA
jgi:hypothetical protein